jgi:hypothetical protein
LRKRVLYLLDGGIESQSVGCHKQYASLVGCSDHLPSLVCGRCQGFLDQQGLTDSDRFKANLVAESRRSDDDDGLDQRIGNQCTIIAVDWNRGERKVPGTFPGSFSADGNKARIWRVMQKMSQVPAAVPSYTDQAYA